MGLPRPPRRPRLHRLVGRFSLAGQRKGYRHAGARPGGPWDLHRGPELRWSRFRRADDWYFEWWSLRTVAPACRDLSHGQRARGAGSRRHGRDGRGRPLDAGSPGATSSHAEATADARDDSTISHGTLVAGVAAATTNNGIGIAGAAWDTRVLPVKVLDSRGLRHRPAGRGRDRVGRRPRRRRS